tara:strand:- start:84 stop:362 length:279 start_codon:yes stop_codon:yes gene_type:complete
VAERGWRRREASRRRGRDRESGERLEPAAVDICSCNFQTSSRSGRFECCYPWHIVAVCRVELVLRDGQPLKSITVGDTVGNRGLSSTSPRTT